MEISMAAFTKEGITNWERSHMHIYNPYVNLLLHLAMTIISPMVHTNLTTMVAIAIIINLNYHIHMTIILNIFLNHNTLKPHPTSSKYLHMIQIHILFMNTRVTIMNEHPLNHHHSNIITPTSLLNHHLPYMMATPTL